LAERTSPELAYLETKFAALVSYGLTIKLLEEVLPIGQDLSTRTIRRQVQQAAERLEAELAQGPSRVPQGHPARRKRAFKTGRSAGRRPRRVLRPRQRPALANRRLVRGDRG
jgi:hypothetical protein